MPVPVPGDPCNPGMEPRLPALKVDSLVSEPPGKLLLLTVSKSLIGIFFWKCSLHQEGDEEVIQSRKLVLVNTQCVSGYFEIYCYSFAWSVPESRCAMKKENI